MKIFVDIHFRSNPDKFDGCSQKGRTQKEHAEEQRGDSDNKMLFNGAPSGAMFELKSCRGREVLYYGKRLLFMQRCAGNNYCL